MSTTSNTGDLPEGYTRTVTVTTVTRLHNGYLDDIDPFDVLRTKLENQTAYICHKKRYERLYAEGADVSQDFEKCCVCDERTCFLTDCGHTVCHRCVNEINISRNVNRCPICRQSIFNLGEHHLYIFKYVKIREYEDGTYKIKLHRSHGVIH